MKRKIFFCVFIILVFILQITNSVYAITLDNTMYNAKVPNNYKLLNSDKTDYVYTELYENNEDANIYFRVNLYDKSAFELTSSTRTVFSTWLNINESDFEGFTKKNLNYDSELLEKENEGYTVANKQLLKIGEFPARRFTIVGTFGNTVDIYQIVSNKYFLEVYFFCDTKSASSNFINKAEQKSIVNSLSIFDANVANSNISDDEDVVETENNQNEDKNIQTENTNTDKKDNNPKNNNTKSNLPFTDVSKSSWYYNAVNYTYSNGIISGYSKTEFAPNDMLTRGMIVTILYRMEGSPNNSGNSGFADVENNAWYSKAIKWAVSNDIVHGYGGTNNFGPRDNIIRQDLAGILRNYAYFKNKNIKISADLSKFSDSNNISGYAQTSMKWAVGKGVITGNKNGTLNPKGNATRAEAAAMIQKYCEKVGK